MFEVVEKLITSKELKTKLPAGDKIFSRRNSIIDSVQDILSGRSLRKILIVGPCSADSEDAFYDYLTRLRGLADKTRDVFLILPRLFTAKPRTRGDSYKGIIHNPDPSGPPDINRGLFLARKMFLTALEDFGFGCADELLYTGLHQYFDDVVCYLTLGSRTSESQHHRFVASLADVPVGVKNPMSGDLSALADSVYSARMENTFEYNGSIVKSGGNPYVHAVLRGRINEKGDSIPNYNAHEILSLKKLFFEKCIPSMGVLIDVNHANSGKKYEKQPHILMSLVKMANGDPEINAFLKGFLLESYIYEGSQKTFAKKGQSLSDGCLGWEATEESILAAAEELRRKNEWRE